MGLEKNTAGKWIVFAFNRTTNVPLTGDAANITANVRIDGGAANAVDDTNPTELEDGYYIFDLTAAETNGDLILIAPVSVTADIQVIGVPGAIYTVAVNSNALLIDSNGIVQSELADAVVHGGTTAKLRLGTTSGDPAIYVTSSTQDESTVKFESTNATAGAALELFAQGSTRGTGLLVKAGLPSSDPSTTQAIYTDGDVVVFGDSTADAFVGAFTGSVSGSVGSVLGGIDTTSGTITTLDGLDTSLDSAHGSGSWLTATGFSTLVVTDILSDGVALNTTSGVLDVVNLVNTTTVNSDMRGTDNALLATSAPTNFGDLAITVTTGQVTVGINNDKTGYSISGTKTTLDALNDIAQTDIVTAGAITTLSGAVVNVDLVDLVTLTTTTTTNIDMRGTDGANTTTPDTAGTTATLLGVAGAALTDLGGMSTVMKGQVNVEVLDVLTVDTFTEVTGIPSANAPFLEMTQWMYTLSRNKGTQTGTTKTLFADDTTTPIATSAITDDGTTFTRNEWS